MPRPRIELKAIFPKRPVGVASATKVVGELRNLAHRIIRKAGDYPVQQATEYVRTGTLGKAWTKDGPKREGKDLIVIVGNNTDYAKFVMGPADEQTNALRDRGWKSIEEIAQEEFDRSKDAISRALDGK